MSTRIADGSLSCPSDLIAELLEHITKRAVGDGLQFWRKGRLPAPERGRNITACQVTGHLRVLRRSSIDHATESRVRCIEFEIGKDAVQCFPRLGDEVLVPDEMCSILTLGPRPAQIADSAVSQERGEVRVGLDVRWSESAAPELLIECKHRAVDVAKVSDQEDLFCLGIELPNEPRQVVGSVLLRHVLNI